MVALDAPQLKRVLSRRHGRELVRAIIVHELGHLVGLDHVNDPGELMHADNVGRLALGPGDREGLAALGSGRCFH
jgi:predicted Zn-dependent protease